jgi:DNA invertase Pin-like site-specific DNA recombinase
MQVVEVITEVVSGAKRKAERPGLERIYDLARKNEITEVLSLELSRLGHNAMDVRTLILELIELGVCTHIVNRNLRSLDSKRRKDSTTMMVLGILADLAQMEKEQLVERINSGLAEARKQGRIGGRRAGEPQKDTEQYFKEYKRVVELLKAGRSLRETQKITGVAKATVIKVKKLLS